MQHCSEILRAVVVGVVAAVVVDADAAEAFDVPATWKLRAQLVFGSVEAPAGEKAFISDEDRFKTFN